MARRKAAPARPTKTATTRRGTRKNAARKTTARKSQAAGRKPAKLAAKAATRRKTAVKKTAKKAPKKTAAKVRKAATRAARPVRKTAAVKSKPAPKSPAVRTAAKPAVRRKPALDRERLRLSGEDIVQSTPPSSLDLDRHATAARSGAAGMEGRLEEHTETGPTITAGDVDADWESAYSTGDEAPGGDNPTPDQDVVEEIGKALGVEYQDNEELKSSDKIIQRDKHRWELDPASSDDWPDR